MNPPDYYDGTESPEEAARIAVMAQRLESEKPTPDASFRGDLGRRLRSHAGSRALTPQRARTLALAYGSSGMVLLVVTAFGLAGFGPFAT